MQVGYAGSTGLTEYRSLVCRIEGDALYLHTTPADRAALNARRGGADGTVLVVNTTRMTAFNRFALAQLWANRSVDGSGVAVLDYYHAKMVEAGLTLDCTFTLVGGATTALRDFTGTKPWAFKPNGYYAADTPAVRWVRDKT